MNKLNWVQGNKLKLSIPLTIVNMDNGESIPYKPQDGDKVRVFLKSMLRSYEYQPTIESESNTLTIEDNGQLEIGTYSVEIFVTEKDGTLRRSKWNKVIQVHDDNSKVLSEFDDFPEYADGAIIEGDGATIDGGVLYPSTTQKTLHWVEGNRLELALPMKIVKFTKEGKVTEDYAPGEGSIIKVVLKGMMKERTFTPKVIENYLHIVDDGTLEADIYAIEIHIVEPDGTKRRSRWEKVLQIHHSNARVVKQFDDFPDYAEGAIIEGSVFFFVGGSIGGSNDAPIPMPDLSEIEAKLEVMQKTIGTHNKEVRFFGIEPVTVKVGDVEHYCEANQVSTVFVGDDDFEIIPTSNRSIQSLLGYPIPLKWFDWLEGVEVFDGIVFDMNEFDTYKHWIQYYQGDYHVQKAQYANCVFWSDKPYTHSPFEEKTNYTIYYSSQLPLCYSRIPANTYKPFYLAYGVNSDPNWRNPDYVSSYSNVSGATQTFSYYGATAIGVFDMAVDVITLPKDCRGLMYHAPAITHAGVFDAEKTTNFGAKKGSWQDAFGDCISLTSLYIRNLKTSINISWSPINNESMEFIIQNAANTSKITISVSPYTWYRLTDEIKAAAAAKNITLALITTNYNDDSRWVTKQDAISDLDTIREGAALGATALQSIPEEYITVTELDGKVDKIEGKGLSTEDFTTILKQKLDGLSNYDDTAISQAVDKLRSDLDALVSGDTTTAIKTFNEVIAFLDGIQDTQDLSGIIASIEQQIAGKMDKVTLSAVATSGSYNDLSNKPTIPDVSNKQDKLVSGSSIKTINGNSLLGSGNIAIGGGITEETDPIFIASPAATITEEKIAEWNGKVDKIEGKGLSTEDFTTILKQKLEGLSNYDDTAISQAVDKLRTDLDALVSGDTTTAIKTFNEVIAFLDGIQDTQDLSGIIASIEQQIAGKMDKVTLSAVATSGSYNDLSNKPTIPDVSNKQDKLVSGTNIKTINGNSLLGSGNVQVGTYSKPSTGIPSADLAQSVQTSLSKAGTAVQPAAIANMEVTTNKVTSISSSSTDTQYPSAKCVYDLVGDIETLLAAI